MAKTKKVEKVAKEKATVTVEKIQPVKIEKAQGAIEGRVSGSHRVKFMPNGTNPALGDKLLMPAATTAQTLVDKGFGDIIE